MSLNNLSLILKNNPDLFGIVFYFQGARMAVMEVLGKLFGSNNRAKLLRLFLFNPEANLDSQAISRMSRIAQANLRGDLKMLEGIGFIKAKNSRPKSWRLNPNFQFIDQIRAFFNVELVKSKESIVGKFKGCGRIKLLIVAGVFIQNDTSRVDIVVVGDQLKRSIIESAIRGLETEVGRELNYAIMPTEEFLFRVSTADRFVRDILDFPHERIIQKVVF